MVCAAIIGAAVSGLYVYGTQVAENLQAGKSLPESLIPADGEKIIVAAAGGAVAGATGILVGGFLASTYAGAIGTAAISGATSNAVAGQYEAALAAGVEQSLDIFLSGDLFDTTEFFQTATNEGFLQGDVFVFDIATGAFVGGVIKWGTGKILGPDLHPSIKPRPSHAEIARLRGYATGLNASVVRRVGDVVSEYAQRKFCEIAKPYIFPQ